MDLGAYMQIDDLDEIAKDNGIEVPRLRGYSLMIDEEPVSQKEINDAVNEHAIRICKDLCCANPFWNAGSNWFSFDLYTDRICNYYLKGVKDETGWVEHTGIRWDRIHGRKRKILKLAIKKFRKKIQKQYDMWNKYAGKENVLYIHARIGGENWEYYGGNELAKQPWFLDKVDDCYDCTYCDIFAALK